MQRYIALLRGINVGGHRIIKMESLRAVLSDANFYHVRTYLQSGNLIFDVELTDEKELQRRLTALIRQHFGFDIPVLVLRPKELVHIISDNPFAMRSETDALQPYVVFLSEEPLLDSHHKLDSLSFYPDSFAVGKKVLYIWYTLSPGKSKLTTDWIEKKLQVIATMRNWKTIQKLAEIAAS